LRIKVIDSHTGGEPTRVVIQGFPELKGATLAEKREDFTANFDHLRCGILAEPRGSDIIVGALLTEPCDPTCDFGVIYFNNAGMLGMCGHGTIGVVETLKHLGKIEVGKVNFDTPVGKVSAELFEDGKVAFQNVASYRFRKDVVCNSTSDFIGDIAYGGNWFFLTNCPIPIEMANTAQFSQITVQVLQDLSDQNITGESDAKIDHVELFGKSQIADSKNFVLCPGGQYDRSPCGTGTSAKLACLYDDGNLKEGELWRQESITGSVFEAYVTVVDGKILPTVIGTAHIVAESELIFSEDDPLRWGARL
jgi:4-hydroxyproline epimerase